MPPVVAAGAAVAAGALTSALGIGGIAAIAIKAAVSIGVSALMSGGKKSTPAQASTSFTRERTLTVRQAISAWRVIYGEARVGGALTYMKSTDSNTYLNLLITVAGHPVDSFREVYFDDEPVAFAPAGSGRFTVAGRYAGYAELWFGEGAGGTNEQALLADLATNSGGEWTAGHKQSGRAKLYARLRFSADLYPNGLPNITVVVRGKKVFDPRTDVTAWSPNAALCTADYLASTAYGLAAPYATEFDDALALAAANVCDEMVTVVEAGDTFTADSATDTLTRTTFNARLANGDRFRLTTTGTLPAGLALATDYYAIKTGKGTLKAASSHANALAGTAVNITDAGSGTHTITRTAEPRYTCNGTFETDAKPNEILGRLLSAMQGEAVSTGGLWKLYAGAWRAPTVTLDEDDARAGIRVETRITRRESFNRVKGTYVSPYDSWQETDFPAVTNATYLAEDNGEPSWRDIELPFTDSASMAQRIAKIELETARQQITVNYPGKLSSYRIEPPEVIALDNTRRGWSGKTFKTVQGELRLEGADGDNPVLGYDLLLREAAATVYDWNSGEETTVDPAPDTDLPNPFAVQPPGALTVSEEIYVTRSGDGVKAKAVLDWSVSPDGFLRDYQVEFKLTAAADWTFLEYTSSTHSEILDVAPGAYQFRVKALNQLGVSSPYSTASQSISGLSDPPATPANLTISAIGGLALLRWDLSAELDVKIGGAYEFRHSPATSGATVATSVGIGEAVPGYSTLAVLPLKPGTYLVRARDSSGNYSTTPATVVTTQASVLTYTSAGSATEDPGFTGSKTDVVLTGGNLQLVPPAVTGTYLFANSIDLGSVKNVRLTSAVTATIALTTDTIDSRTENMDDWESFDGTTSGPADCRVHCRATDDDPAGSPTWGPWQRLDSAEFRARAFQFKAVLTTDDAAYNIFVSGLSVLAGEVL